jgi:putative tryptophan/tyrosine transport system substrate-binding protein
VDRRAFLAGAVAVLATPLAAEAQGGGKVATLAVFAPSPQRQAPQDVFEQSLQVLGWIKGQNIRVEIRAPTRPEGGVALAIAELIALKPDVLVAWTSVGALAAKQATTQIPVVFLGTGDPVGLGLVTSLAHPGGNLTGVSAIASSEEFAKRLALLKEAVPSTTRVAVLVSLDSRPMLNLNRQAMATAAQSLSLELHEIQIETSAQLETAIRQAKMRGAQALYIWPSGLTFEFGKRIADLALAARLPSVHPFTESAVAGGLLSYSASVSDIARHGAIYVDRILKGARPSDLPVEQPTKFELVINMKTAKALGLTIPPSLLARADQIIE